MIEWDEFDAIELNTVFFYTEPDSNKVAEVIHGPEEWRRMKEDYDRFESDIMYSVYGHLIVGGVRCLCDCATPADARAIGRAFADAQGYTVGDNGVVDLIYVPGDEKATMPIVPRQPLDVLRALVALAESQCMPLRIDEGDPKIHGAKSTDYFGEFDNYYDDSDLSRGRDGVHRDMGGLMISGGSVRICWPELAALIDEANASIERLGATTASI